MAKLKHFETVILGFCGASIFFFFSQNEKNSLRSWELLQTWGIKPLTTGLVDSAQVMATLSFIISLFYIWKCFSLNELVE